MPKIEKHEIENLPASPGCYIYTDSDDKILYIGKSKNLRNRVSQYFGKRSNEDLKIRMLIRQIDGIEYVETDTDIEAILLENKLIRRYRPVFNSKMNKDLKPNLICINTSHERPGVYFSKQAHDGDLCFRVYRRGWIGSNLKKLFSDVWHTPICGKRYFTEPYAVPCMQFRMGKCAAPCSADADMDKYHRILDDLRGFFERDDESALNRLQAEMAELSENCEFERAAAARDRYNYLLNIKRYAEPGNFTFENKKVCVFVRSSREKAFLMCYVENGSIQIQRKFLLFQDFTKTKQNKIAGQILEKAWDKTGENFDAVSLLEISAKRIFVDLTDAVNKGNIVRAMGKGFLKFTQK